ncbi:hypothetical protein EAP58_14775 [Salmonella enterica]|nr:hypothetical protein [Salmonella enterica]
MSCIDGRLLQEEIRRAEERLRAYPSFEMEFSHNRDVILFQASLFEGGIRGKVPDECIRIKHSEYVALLEE